MKPSVLGVKDLILGMVFSLLWATLFFLIGCGCLYFALPSDWPARVAALDQDVFHACLVSSIKQWWSACVISFLLWNKHPRNNNVLFLNLSISTVAFFALFAGVFKLTNLYLMIVPNPELYIEAEWIKSNASIISALFICWSLNYAARVSWRNKLQLEKAKKDLKSGAMVN